MRAKIVRNDAKETGRTTNTGMILLLSELDKPKSWRCYRCGDVMGNVFDLVKDQHGVCYAYCPNCWEKAFRQLEALNFPRKSGTGEDGKPEFSMLIARHGLAFFYDHDKWEDASDKSDQGLIIIPELKTTEKPEKPA